MSTIRLDYWSVCHGGSNLINPYMAPELAVDLNGLELHGKVTGHPRKTDGKIISTSRIVGKRNDLVVTGSGSEYDLGEIDPEYVKAYPSAKEAKAKLMDALSEV